MANQQGKPTLYVLALGVLIGLSRWLLPMSDTRGRIVIGCGLALVAIDLTVIQYRLLRRMNGVPVKSRVVLLGLLTGSTVLVSALSLPAALADPEWLSDCKAPLLGEHRFGNFGPDYILESRHPMVIPPSDVEAWIFTYDGYEGRTDSFAPEQIAESLRIEFYLGEILQGASAASPDLVDGTEYDEWVGSLGVVVLPNGADEIVIAHPGKYAGMPQANSIATNGACLSINEYPPPTTTAPPTTAPASTVPPETVPPETVPPEIVPPPTTVMHTTTTAYTTTTASPTTSAAPTTMTTPPTTDLAPTTTSTSSTVPATTTTVPGSTTTAPLPTTARPTSVPPPTTTPPPTTPPTTTPPTTTPPTTAPPTTAPAAQVSSVDDPPTLTKKLFGPPPADRIGTPPSSLAYTGSAVAQAATAAWLFLLAGVSMQLLFAEGSKLAHREVL